MDALLCTMNADSRYEKPCHSVFLYTGIQMYNIHGFKHLTQYKTAYKDKILKMVCCLVSQLRTH